MKIALIGATGFVGSAILREALERRFRSRQRGERFYTE